MLLLPHSRYRWYVEDLSDGQRYDVTPEGVDEALLDLAFWLPHPTENRIAFSYGNDVYIKYDPKGTTAQRYALSYLYLCVEVYPTFR